MGLDLWRIITQNEKLDIRDIPFTVSQQAQEEFQYIINIDIHYL